LNLNILGNESELVIYMLEAKMLTKDKLLSSFKVSQIPELNKAVELSIQHDQHDQLKESRILVGSLLVKEERTESTSSLPETKSLSQSDSSQSLKYRENRNFCQKSKSRGNRDFIQISKP